MADVDPIASKSAKEVEIKQIPKNRSTGGRVNESMLRLSFLEQAARLLAVQSLIKDDIASLLSKNYVKELREISFAEQLRMDTEFKRTICKKCHRMWVSNNKKPTISISKGRKKIYRKCMDCITLVQLAAGQFPYQSSTPFELMVQIREEQPPLLSPSNGFSQEFCDFIKDCLQKDMAERPKFKDLMDKPFLVRSQAETTDVGQWYQAEYQQA
uniref:Uncharacterized protein n=1 Tax=Ditylenchus dipsaci TaxID=166011 RepID=A0A915E016_9BILA